VARLPTRPFADSPTRRSRGKRLRLQLRRAKNTDGLKYVLREFVGRPLPECRPRELSLPTESDKVIGLSGVRRCGKTFLSSSMPGCWRMQA
jgi:hypothetical protein